MERIAESILYPVVCFITGTTPNGGGIWKYILHGSPQGLLRRNLPVLTQVLHFLDFNVSPHILNDRWRKPLSESYNGNFKLNYKGPIFTDSGGFTLMFDPNLNLAKYGIMPEKLAEGILKLQIDLGATLVASLDYPIPPNLDESEVRRRMAATLENALRSARYLASIPEQKRPLLYVPIHGPTPDSLSQFTHDLLERFKVEGLETLLAGLALGSMVPLRKAHRTDEILAFTRAARSAMPINMPLHVFGVTGLLTPFLLAEGATSFDTSGYVQNARTLQYLTPTTWQKTSLRNLVNYPCNCIICQGRDVADDLALLEGKREGQKSEVYAAIALHNLELDLQLLTNANKANSYGELPSFLHFIGAKYNSAKKLLIAFENSNSKQANNKITAYFTIHQHEPDDFDLRKLFREYRPGKSACLILPCSQEKPYPISQSFKYVWKKLQESLEETKLADLEIVFLSGLYGPVPLVYTEEEAVKTYDFLLHPNDQAGIERVAERLAAFLENYSMDFTSIFAYVTLPAYRKAVDLVARNYSYLTVLPKTNRMGQLAFYKSENIQQLIQQFQPKLLATESLEDMVSSKGQLPNT